MEPNYKCSIEELYTGATMLKNSLLAELAAFAAHKPKYNAVFVDSFKNAIDAADAIPDETQRNADNEAKRYLLMRRLKAAPDAIEPAEGELMLGKLRNYIEGAYADKGYRKIMLKDAGLGDYEKFMRFNWETVREVLNKGKEFITEKLTELTANSNMPAAFETEYVTFANEIIAEVDDYLQIREEVRLITQSKILANNAVFETVREICSDGQTLFARNPAKRGQFTWATIMEIVTPPGAAGLRGTVKVEGSNLPLAGVLMEMQTQEGVPVTFVTDADGRYFSGNLAVGMYSLKLTKAGFATIETEVEIKVGTTSYKHFKLSAGSGTVVIAEGGLGLDEKAEVVLPAGINDDTSVTMEELGTQMKFYAGDSAGGAQTGTGALYVNMGLPLEMKWSQVVAEVGLNGVHSFFNVHNVGVGSGGWRVTFVVG